MDTINRPKQSLAFINDKSLILDSICNDLSGSGFEILFRLEHVEDGITQLSALKALPEVCIIDLDFYDNDVLVQLQCIFRTILHHHSAPKYTSDSGAKYTTLV